MSDAQQGVNHLQANPSANIIDVFQILPMDVVTENVWKLLDREASRALRQSCKQARAWVDTYVIMAVALSDERSASRFLPSQMRQLSLEAWHADVEQRASFLGRLSGLRVLKLTTWPSPAALATLLGRYGDSTKGRIINLELLGAHLDTAATSSVQAAFPGLQSLRMTCFSESRANAVEGDLLWPLRNLALIKVRT